MLNAVSKRILDLVFATVGLASLAPLFGCVAIGIKLDDGGPVFFRQTRIGLRGKEFEILKFRTMVVDAEMLGSSITRGGDSRVTRIGRVLRKYKIDELPQLWNVIVNEMSMVGPRPEVPKYVALYTEPQRRILEIKPGITDLASIEFRDEEVLLNEAEDYETFYRTCCIPRKIEISLKYQDRASVLSDLGIIFKTLLRI